MFTGIIEAQGTVNDIKQEGTNKHFRLTSPFTSELKIDQSLAHNGVCLTVVQIQGDTYDVTAIDETLKKTNLGSLQIGDTINLERCMPANGRFDGHVVQGHVDQTARCLEVQDQDGSWLYTFQYEAGMGNITVEKGSICINGISLTVVNSADNQFSVAIIPYTYEHTN
ncbi:MAG: riboflavin synthase, partial [Cytophagales bacterium CG18_big_fil_WC_8_21_14_2_50_42_9]